MANHEEADIQKLFTPTIKAYKNNAFIGSNEGRAIRILCEYEETRNRLAKHNVQATVLIFGSARAKSPSQYAEALAKLEAQRAHVAAGGESEELTKIDKQIAILKSTEWMCPMFEKVEELSHKLTAWACRSDKKLALGRRITGVSRFSNSADSNIEEQEEVEQKFLVCTGGGPGFMEAANKGAAKAGQTIGMGISLPFEPGLNPYVTDSLAFEFHYFFTRKFWMVYHCQALIVAPGGVGTMDEIFEVLTLKQTRKIQSDLPVVLLGKEYWQTIVNWQALVNYGVIGQKDIDDLFFTDDVDEAFTYITGKLQTNPIFALPTHKENVEI